MYEVGIWFVHLMNLAILAIVAVVILVVKDVKKGQYQREARRCVQVELKLSTGWSDYFTVPCGMNDAWVTVKGCRYKLNPKKISWGLHPRLPFMGLASLQIPIRKETFYKDNSNPAFQDKTTPPITAAEIEAMTKEAMATTAAAQAIELASQQKALINAIGNQPNKMYVYVGLGAIIIGIIALVVRDLL